MPQNQGTTELFQNKALESLTRTSASIAYTYYPAVALFFFFLNFWINDLRVTTLVLTFFVGILYWTLFEYLFHRFVFHMTNESDASKKIAYTLHGVHHDFPLDKDRLIMPPLPWTILVGAFCLIYYLVLGDLAFAFLGGKLIGYVLYVFVHYQIHIPNTPKFLRKQKIHHAIHHYQMDDKAFGVSSPLWDHLFRTMPPAKSYGMGFEKKEHG